MKITATSYDTFAAGDTVAIDLDYHAYVHGMALSANHSVLGKFPAYEPNANVVALIKYELAKLALDKITEDEFAEFVWSFIADHYDATVTE